MQKNPINHYIFKKQAQLIQLVLDYFKWVNKKPPFLGVQIAKKKQMNPFCQQKEQKNFADFT